MKQPKKPKLHIQIVGRRWFQRSYGNTYHTVDVFVDGEHKHTSERRYGYGDQYEQSAWDWLDASGLLPKAREKYQWGGSESPWSFCENNAIAYFNIVSDVSRQKDL